ncbi:hypothetical protein PSPO01_00224 [Paraphaeosphaeria sporulosa]
MPTQSGVSHKPADALEVSSLNPLSNGLLHTRNGANSKVHAPTSVPPHDLLVKNSAIGAQQISSSGAPNTVDLLHHNTPSSARSNGKEDLANGGVTATLLSRDSIRTLRTVGSREHFSISATRDSGDNFLTPRPRMSMNSNDGATASRHSIDPRDSNLVTTLAETLNMVGARSSKTVVIPRSAWAAGWGLRDNIFDMKTDKRSATSPWQPIGNALTESKRDEMSPTSMQNSEENGSALPRALPQQSIIERAVVTLHEGIAASQRIEIPQNFSDISRTRPTLDSILPADRTLARETDLVDSLEPAFLARKRMERTDRREIQKQRMTFRRTEKGERGGKGGKAGSRSGGGQGQSQELQFLEEKSCERATDRCRDGTDKCCSRDV